MSVQGMPVKVTQDPADGTSTNDEVATEVNITTLPYAAVIASTYTENATDPVHSCTTSKDLDTAWYKFTAPAAGTIYLTHYGVAVLTTYREATGGGVGAEYTCYSAQPGTISVRYTLTVTAGMVLYIESSFHTASTAARGLSIQMVNTTPIGISVKADTTTVSAGGQAHLTATVAGTTNTAVRWTITPPIGGISPAGVYTAPATLPVSATVLATATSFADNATQSSVLLNLKGAQPASSVVTGVQNAASYATAGVSPGELIVIYGTGFGADQLTGITLTSGGSVDSATGNTRVFFDGIAAPLIYSAPDQISVVVPYEVANRATTMMEVKTGDQYSSAYPLVVAATAPGLFLVDPAHTTQLALFNADGTLNSADNPAPKGSIVTCYGTGEGATTPTSTNGQINTKTLPKPIQAGSLKVGGQTATINYLGAAPGFVAGVFQMNFTVPTAAASGASVPVVLTIGGRTSQATATMAVQ